jgi:hypothetical protein
MAGQNFIWQVSSSNIGTGEGVVNQSYNIDGKSPFTTITLSNPTGYIPINSSSNDSVIKKLSYAIRTDGKITYQYDDGTGNKIQYNSIQEIANDFGISGYTDSTSRQIQSAMQSNLRYVAQQKNIGPTIASGGNAGTSTNVGTPEPVNIDNVNPAALEVNENNKEISDSEKIRYSYGSEGNLRYPLKLNLKSQDCIQFKMFRYVGRSLGAISAETIGNTKISGPSATARRGTEIAGTVTLPIQPSITDSNGVEWGGANLNPLEAYAASIARGAMDEKGSVADLASNIFGKVSQNLKELPTNTDLQNAFKLYLAQEAVGVQGLFSRTTGAILNPNLELLFNGPTLRPFNFTFRLSPRSEKEAENVKRIIRFFKQGMSVKTSNTTVFLKAPNIFQIKYLSGSSDHPSLNRIKDCALLGCDVDYTPDGTYMTFDDPGKTMTSYQLTLRFSELEPVYEDDYFNEGLRSDDIGY